ncbi:hypothetical protein [Sulfuricurvum sp.]|uniref:hypothetical protein n=1 Tax=Sulfuricurvum sp. TaxID=2025608 RepID=UPI00261FC8B6|nr:hypothetical protein [Sulfuricurvum sp.]MDD3596537.1 hypothetical protein [Sulfuricurvum sp.]
MKAIFEDNGYGSVRTKRNGYVCVEKAALWSEPNVVSTPVNFLERGTKIEVLETSGTHFLFHRIIIDQVNLWISAYNVTISDR